jgi:hypothetical protein
VKFSNKLGHLLNALKQGLSRNPIPSQNYKPMRERADER